MSLLTVAMNASNQITDILDLEKNSLIIRNENVSYQNTEQGPPTWVLVQLGATWIYQCQIAVSLKTAVELNPYLHSQAVLVIQMERDSKQTKISTFYYEKYLLDAFVHR
jgi:hypothetical protein